jgi:hypothetical protein
VLPSMSVKRKVTVPEGRSAIVHPINVVGQAPHRLSHAVGTTESPRSLCWGINWWGDQDSAVEGATPATVQNTPLVTLRWSSDDLMAVAATG